MIKGISKNVLLILIVVPLVGGGLYFLNKTASPNPVNNTNSQKNQSNNSVQKKSEGAQVTTDESTEKMEKSIFTQLTTLHSELKQQGLGISYPKDFIKSVDVVKKLENGAYIVMVETSEKPNSEAHHYVLTQYIYKTLFQDKSLNIDMVQTLVKIPAMDKYGNPTEEVFILASLYVTEADKINWDSDKLFFVLGDLTTCTGRGCYRN